MKPYRVSPQQSVQRSVQLKKTSEMKVFQRLYLLFSLSLSAVYSTTLKDYALYRLFCKLLISQFLIIFSIPMSIVAKSYEFSLDKTFYISIHSVNGFTGLSLTLVFISCRFTHLHVIAHYQSFFVRMILLKNCLICCKVEYRVILTASYYHLSSKT